MGLTGVRAWVGLVAVTGLCSFAAAAPAAAQTSRMDVSGGYQFTNGQGLNLNGWYADLSVPFTKLTSFVGDFSGSYMSQSLSDTFFSVDASLSVHTFMGGVRFAKKFQSNLVPFGQALAGGATSHATAKFSGGFLELVTLDPLDVSGTSTDFAIQLGGGLDVMIHPKFGVRAGVSYVRIFTNSGFNGFRVDVGGVVPIGSK